MIVQANDNRGINTKYTNVTVTVNVLRNQAPFFLNEPCRFSISEKAALSTSLYRIQATDSDLIGDLIYTVQGDGLAPGYFSVDTVAGVITAIADLWVDRALLYTVCFGLSTHFILYSIKLKDKVLTMIFKKKNTDSDRVK